MLTIPVVAMASDLPGPLTKAPVPYHKPIHQWTGFYAGANIGYGIAGLSDNTPLAITSNMTGFIGGVQAGYNHQTANNLVFGLEADVQYSAQRTSYGGTAPILGGFSLSQEIPYFATARARLGYAFTCGCVMAYGTVGIAYGAYRPTADALGLSLSHSYTRAALAAGAGVEWMVAERWSTKLEVIYMDTGNIGTGITLPVIGEVHMRVRDAVARLGLNYHF